jgi:L-aspartate oxidase
VEAADVVVVGSGVAGLAAALELARENPPLAVALLTRGRVGGHGASPLAQGGVAAALDPSDSPELHALDTQVAADGLADPELVEILTGDGPDRVRDLIRLGARFDRAASGGLALGLEGAHSRRRILHAQGDRTGAEVTRALREAVTSFPAVRVLEQMEAVGLLRGERGVRGVLARDCTGAVHRFEARATVLATGGPGRVYLHTTAPPGLNGDGLAMAARAGARLRDLEFVQFHPTALNVPADPLPLVTEALRGAGARLVDAAGGPLEVSASGVELAPRDQVARAIWRRIREGDAVFLDTREALGEGIRDRFPGAYALCRSHGVDPIRDPIPVTPAAHYHMGGVAVDAEGRSSLPGLWAAGEAAASGLHGANRLASNSLLEGLVFGPRVARSIARTLAGATAPEDARSVHIDPGPLDAGRLPAEVIGEIRVLMWERVGIVREEKGLESAIARLDSLEAEMEGSVAPHARNLLLSARLIARAALLRRESLGSHFREDYPARSSGRPRHSVVTMEPAALEEIELRLEGDGVSPTRRPASGDRGAQATGR